MRLSAFAVPARSISHYASLAFACILHNPTRQRVNARADTLRLFRASHTACD